MTFFNLGRLRFPHALRTPLRLTLTLGMGILILNGCTGETSTNDLETTPSEMDSPAVESSPNSDQDDSTDHPTAQYGGQVVETGDYHLELVPIPEDSGIHLDFYVQTRDDLETIPNATVTAQIQLPDGQEMEIPMEYDAPGEHYFAFLPSQASGDYLVVMLTEVEGTRTNARFRFSQ